MGKTSANFLDTNERFPELELHLTNGNTYKLPDDIGNKYGVFLVLRGKW